MAVVSEGYTPKVMTASGAVFAGTGTFCGFFCTTAGNVTVNDASGTNLVPIFAAVVGTFYVLPIAANNGVSLVLSAQGTAFWGAP